MDKVESICNYLEGESFDSGKIFDFSYMPQKNETRISITKKLLKDKRVVHLGACDHKECIYEKRKKGVWIHDIICDTAKEVIGVDINDEAVKYCNENGIKNIFSADITKDVDVVREWLHRGKGYVLYAGEILEHISNPVVFLNGIRENYQNEIKEIVITVPNAFRLDNFRFALKGEEGINTDHRHWFSPFTLSKICTDAGIKVKEVYLVNYASGRLAKLIKKKYPKNLFYDNIVLVGEL